MVQQRRGSGGRKAYDAAVRYLVIGDQGELLVPVEQAHPGIEAPESNGRVPEKTQRSHDLEFKEAAAT